MLCENCQQSALNDDSPIFQVETDDSGYVSVVTDEDEKIPTDYYLRDEFPELPSLSRSSHRGCEFCSFLRESILSNDVANCLQINYGLRAARLKGKIDLHVCYFWNSQIKDTNIRKHFLQIIVGFVNINVRFGILCNIKAAKKDDPVAKWLCLDGPSTRAFTSAKTIRWIKACISECKEHDHALPTPNFVPRLLLDVRGKTPKLMDQDALISSWKTRGQLKIQTPRYAALSYCWGTAEDAKAQLKTTRSSVSKWQVGIEEQEVTPVLRDAILITKRLSIPYLWIDSLCIFQDDTEDWNRQCADMDKIYGHAEITIVAAASTSCREGFMEPRAPQIQLPFRSALNHELQGSMRIELREVAINLAAISSDLYIDSLGSRLATRGWAVQERILSQRQIMFGRSNVHFFCPWRYQSYGGPRSSGGWQTTIHSPRETENAQDLYSDWAAMLDEFGCITEDSFTCATDRLPAMSGLAADFAKRLKDDYFAGHWGNDLVMDLMWNRDTSIRASKSVHLKRICSPIQYLAPSWSRFSQPGPQSTLRVGANVRSYQSAVEYIGAHTTLKGNNAFGAIKGGELRVRSHSMYLPATDVICFKSMEPLFENWARQIYRCRLTFERYDGEGLSCDIRLDYELLMAEIQEEVKLWRWILLGTCKIPSRLARPEEEHNDDEYPFGLIIHQIRGTEWCRIGMFEPAWRNLKGSRLSLQTFQSASRLEDIAII